MKKLTSSFLIVFFAIYIFQSCDSQKTIIDNVPADKLNKTFTISMKDTLKIQLKTNPTTGFLWSLDNKIKPRVIKELSREYVKNNKTMDMIGAGGFDILKFIPVKTGEVFLHFIYAREIGKIDKEKYFKVVVKE